MKIIVCIKQVPNTSEVKINPETKTLIRDGVESIINPDDKNALEAALKIKDEKGAKVVVVSMGPMQAKEALLEALAMGADSAYLISDRKFGGSEIVMTVCRGLPSASVSATSKLREDLNTMSLRLVDCRIVPTGVLSISVIMN